MPDSTALQLPAPNLQSGEAPLQSEGFRPFGVPRASECDAVMNQKGGTALGLVWDRRRALDGFHGLPAPLKRRSRGAGNWIYSKRNVRAILHGLQDS